MSKNRKPDIDSLVEGVICIDEYTSQTLRSLKPVGNSLAVIIVTSSRVRALLSEPRLFFGARYSFL
jgi:hypothetical protein